MTDFTPLLTADRGQKARADPSRRQGQGFEAWLKTRPAEDRALLEAQRFDGKNRVRLRPAAARRRVRGRQRGQERRRAIALVPRQACREPARRHYRLASGEARQGGARLAARPAPFRCLSLEDRGAGAAARACSSPARRRRSMRPCGSPKRPRWCATSSTRRPAISARPSSSRRCARRRPGSARRSGSSAGKELTEGYPLIAAVGGAATPERARRA